MEDFPILGNDIECAIHDRLTLSIRRQRGGGYRWTPLDQTKQPANFIYFPCILPVYHRGCCLRKSECIALQYAGSVASHDGVVIFHGMKVLRHAFHCLYELHDTF